LACVFLGDHSAPSILKVRQRRRELGIEAVFKVVDTCAAEFEAVTPYYYSTYQPGRRVVDASGASAPVAPEDELSLRLAATADEGQFVVILGGGPNRIGQGIEFDY